VEIVITELEELYHETSIKSIKNCTVLVEKICGRSGRSWGEISEAGGKLSHGISHTPEVRK